MLVKVFTVINHRLQGTAGNRKAEFWHFTMSLQRMCTSVNGQQQLLYQVTAELCSSLKTEITNVFSQCFELEL